MTFRVLIHLLTLLFVPILQADSERGPKTKYVNETEYTLVGYDLQVRDENKAYGRLRGCYVADIDPEGDGVDWTLKSGEIKHDAAFSMAFLGETSAVLVEIDVLLDTGTNEYHFYQKAWIPRKVRAFGMTIISLNDDGSADLLLQWLK